MDEIAERVPPVDFDFDTAANDEFQKEAVRASWLKSSATTFHRPSCLSRSAATE